MKQLLRRLEALETRNRKYAQIDVAHYMQDKRRSLKFSNQNEWLDEIESQWSAAPIVAGQSRIGDQVLEGRERLLSLLRRN